MSSTSHGSGVLYTIERAPRLLVQQVFKPIGNEYRISVPPEGTTDEGEPLLFVKQKKLKIREDIRFRLSPEEEAHLFMLKSTSVFEFRGRHEVLDGSDRLIGSVEKDFARSLLRSHWRVRDPEGNELLEAYEANLVVAVLRRFEFPWLPFNFVLARNGEQAGTYRRVLGKLRDRYVVDLGPALQDVDRRLVLALAVALDALQDR